MAYKLEDLLDKEEKIEPKKKNIVKEVKEEPEEKEEIEVEDKENKVVEKDKFSIMLGRVIASVLTALILSCLVALTVKLFILLF